MGLRDMNSLLTAWPTVLYIAICPELKTLMHSAGWQPLGESNLLTSPYEVDGTCCPSSMLPLLDWVKSSTLQKAA